MPTETGILLCRYLIGYFLFFYPPAPPVLGIQPPYLRLWRGKGSNLRFTFFSSPHLLRNWPGAGPPPPSSCFHIQDGFGKRPFAFSVPTPCPFTISDSPISSYTWGQEGGGGNLSEPKICFLKSCTAFAFPSPCFHKVTHRGKKLFSQREKVLASCLEVWQISVRRATTRASFEKAKKKNSCCGGGAEGEAICCRQAPEPRKTLPSPVFYANHLPFLCHSS